VFVVVDNTFASPYVQRPLELGFDLVVHSVTKYLNGHSDVIGGIAIVAKANGDARLEALRERLGFLQNAVGAIAGPFDSFLALRGVKTLAIRMQRHVASALELARWLERQPQVARVHYPGLESHPQHALARRQMTGGFGGMISLDLRTDLAGARRFLEAVQIFALAESLGGVESLIEHPAIMTHATIPAETRQRLGIGDALAGKLQFVLQARNGFLRQAGIFGLGNRRLGGGRRAVERLDPLFERRVLLEERIGLPPAFVDLLDPGVELLRKIGDAPVALLDLARRRAVASETECGIAGRPAERQADDGREQDAARAAPACRRPAAVSAPLVVHAIRSARDVSFEIRRKRRRVQAPLPCRMNGR
jgi:hypothetical protein